jgi:hypothetical protein
MLRILLPRRAGFDAYQLPPWLGPAVPAILAPHPPSPQQSELYERSSTLQTLPYKLCEHLIFSKAVRYYEKLIW